MSELTGVSAAGRLGLSEREAAAIAFAWFDVGHWVNLRITAMARREFRAAAGLLPEIGEAATQLGDSVPRAHWVPGLAKVLDDEPILVVDHVTGRGFRLTMSGVGDNFQRHTVIADRLLGDPARGLVGGEPPAPAWVAAATTAPPQRLADDPIQRRFRLFDGAGAYIYPEGRPADIPPVDGVRVIVLYPTAGQLQLGLRADLRAHGPGSHARPHHDPRRGGRLALTHRSRPRDRPFRSQPRLGRPSCGSRPPCPDSARKSPPFGAVTVSS